MGRPLRIDPAGGWHHVVNRGVDRRDIFMSDADRVEFGRLLGVAHDQHGVRVHAYCLMTNHYHLLVECPDGGLSAAMQQIGSTYVRHVNERVGRDGPLFRGRFFARAVRSDAQVVAVARYIHRNPLAMVDEGDLASYRWSSLRTYLGHRRCPPWLYTDPVTALSGGRSGLEELTSSGASKGRRSSPPDLWAHIAGLMVDEHLGDLARQRAERTVLALALDRVDGAPARAVRSALAFPTPGAERAARSRARSRARELPELDVAVAGLLRAAA